MGGDGFNALFVDLGLPIAYTPGLGLRLATGMAAGVALAFAVVPAIAAPRANPLTTDVSRPGLLVAALAWAVGAVYGLLVVSGRPSLLLPVGPTSVGGVVLLLTMASRVTLGWSAMQPLGLQRPWPLAAAATTLAVAVLGFLALLRALLL